MDRKRFRKWFGWGMGVFFALTGLFLMVMGLYKMLTGDPFGVEMTAVGVAVIPAYNPFRFPSNDDEGGGTE